MPCVGLLYGLLVPSAASLAIMAGLFFLSAYTGVPVLLVFAAYGGMMAALGTVRNLAVVHFFNRPAFMLGSAIYMKTASTPRTSDQNAIVLWDEKANKIISGLSVLFWLAAGCALGLLLSQSP
jgi:hypothetical protein